ncbi:MAG: response regulator transcription factor, partial [Oscillospiraceae bacterium]
KTRGIPPKSWMPRVFIPAIKLRIFQTALSDEDDKLFGYKLGADDYVTKPFTKSVLYAKTAGLIKRHRGNMRTSGKMEAGGITLKFSSNKVFAGKKIVTLTPKEYALLLCLMRNKTW